MNAGISRKMKKLASGYASCTRANSANTASLTAAYSNPVFTLFHITLRQIERRSVSIVQGIPFMSGERRVT